MVENIISGGNRVVGATDIQCVHNNLTSEVKASNCLAMLVLSTRLLPRVGKVKQTPTIDTPTWAIGLRIFGSV